LGEADAGATRERVPGGQHRQQALTLDRLDDQPALLERHAQEADMDAALAQRLGLDAGEEEVEVVLHGGDGRVPHPERARQDVEVGGRREADVELADLAPSGALRGAHGALRLREYLAHLVGERLPGGRDLDAPLRALEERDAEFLLELSDLLAERGLRDAKARCGAPEVQLLCYGEEGAEVAELHQTRSIHQESQSLHGNVLDRGRQAGLGGASAGPLRFRRGTTRRPIRRRNDNMLSSLQVVRGTTAVVGAVCATIALLAGPAHGAGDACRAGASALSDAKAIAGVRGAIARQCSCADFDGSTPAKSHSKFVQCAKRVIGDALDGTPVLGTFTLRPQCKKEVKQTYAKAACGYPASQPRVMCCEANPSTGQKKAMARKVASCVDSSNGQVVRHACYASAFGPDACSFDLTNSCQTLVVQETQNIPSSAQPAETPGTPGVVVTNPKLLAQFGGGSFSLNNA